jgi:protein-disulfide isomerase
VKEDDGSFLTTPLAILLGSFVIAISILMHGGVININGNHRNNVTPTGTDNIVDTTNTDPGEDKQVSVDPISEKDHVRGDRNARVILFEYSDLECPFCKRFHPTAKQALEEYKGQLAWVYRHFPLDQLHSKARKEAEAVECANELNGEEGFWALTDKIYEVTPANNGLEAAELPKLALQVGLDQTKFKACLDSGKYAPRVESDYQSGLKASVTGTPGNILLDTKTGKTKIIPGAVPLEQLKASIDSLLQS